MTPAQQRRIALGLCSQCGQKRGPKQRGEGIHARSPANTTPCS